MTSNIEMQAYAQDQSDSGAQSVAVELIHAAIRLKRYNDEPLENPDPWCDWYDSHQQYGNDLAMLADYAVSCLVGHCQSKAYSATLGLKRLESELMEKK
jgi:hypothetical protein